MNDEFQRYRRTAIAEMRPVTEQDIEDGMAYLGVSISTEDILAGSPKIGDMIARNPKNHKDKWLVAEQYFKDNFEEIPLLTHD